jgi:hypothetical protein
LTHARTRSRPGTLEGLCLRSTLLPTLPPALLESWPSSASKTPARRRPRTLMMVPAMRRRGVACRLFTRTRHPPASTLVAIIPLRLRINQLRAKTRGLCACWTVARSGKRPPCTRMARSDKQTARINRCELLCCSSSCFAPDLSTFTSFMTFGLRDPGRR